MIDKMKYRDIRQSVNYANYLKSQGWIVERIENINYFIKKIPLIGSVLKVQRPRNLDFKRITELASEYRVFQIVIEPNLVITSGITRVHDLMIHHGFKLSKSPYLPSKTLQIDLSQSTDQITAKFDKETRRAIRRGEDLDIKEYSSPDELDIFYNAWKKSVKVGRYVPSLTNLINLRKSFPNNYSTFLASHNIYNKIIGGGVFTRSSTDFSYYWYGFTNYEGRTSLSQYSLLYQGILWAKSMGCKVFDFEGIYDERFPIKSWLGFTRFKKSFGGYEVLYPGCYTKFRLPL